MINPATMSDRHRRLQLAVTVMKERSAASAGRLTLGADSPEAARSRGALDLAARVIARERRPVRVLIPFADEEQL